MTQTISRESHPFRDRYINPFTDFGFKRLFGEEPNKDILLHFLNTFLAKSNPPL